MNKSLSNTNKCFLYLYGICRIGCCKSRIVTMTSRLSGVFTCITGKCKRERGLHLCSCDHLDCFDPTHHKCPWILPVTIST